ncbi:hypothetical protein M2103_002157 [Ereboglobus sp. PH5-5]|uniref:Uncharacterized protein n=2 Tax=Ereboglobus luteus TaxID=1796921 RepID=A0A2U8E6N9_9BACT|nr:MULTISPECIES: hypothetical protein [unclassified Ereboglobus]AWI10537.1 hypothetical protein CKA38_05435 [Ereboglobus luteus]MDF9827358.1 hypothetical protein [Ereboglobus sp. PH5-10]MDF9833922.1 hypothetical protein [Ereboglobus sp. PH5-5]
MNERLKRERIFDEARKAGVDLDLLDTNLRLSVSERVRRHNEALRLAAKLERAMKARHGRPKHPLEASQ